VICGEQKRQIVLKEYDAKTGLSKMSPNTSRTSSMRSGGETALHDKQSSPHRESPNRDNMPRPDLAEVAEELFPPTTCQSNRYISLPKVTVRAPVFLSPQQHE
jgi:hypothetical protein